ncbi:MAG: hypothetical protein Q7S72_01100 [Candidatus Taylorbacteria bacterium]|nr:hypothetical protein [Candidatus Taylorbacteria bacterium]
MKKYIFVMILSFGLVFGVTTFAADLNLDAYGTFSNIEVVSKTIYIHKGWNLVQGLAGREWITGGIDLQISDIKAIFVLNPINKKYVRFYPDIVKNEVNELVAIPHLTYWVYSDKEGTLHYQTVKPEITKFTWPAGWNIIPISPEFIGKSLESIKGNCVIDRAYWWSPRDQQFIDIMNTSSEVFRNNSNNIGSGLVLRFSNQCKLSASESSTIAPPPQLPNY